MERSLVELEWRLSKRLSDGTAEAGKAAKAVVVAKPVAVVKPPVEVKPSKEALPDEADLAVRIGSELVWGVSGAKFYLAVMRWLFEHGHLTTADLPIKSGKTRFWVATKPVHQNGKPFLSIGEAAPGVFVELNLSRPDKWKRATGQLEKLGIAYEVVKGV